MQPFPIDNKALSPITLILNWFSLNNAIRNRFSTQLYSDGHPCLVCHFDINFAIFEIHHSSFDTGERPAASSTAMAQSKHNGLGKRYGLSR